MDPISVPDLASVIGGHVATASDSPKWAMVESITIDSRQVGSAAAFFALAGETVDGHRFVGDALAGGAVVAVVSKAWIEAGQAPDSDSKPRLIVVDDPLTALQRLAAWWRRQIDARFVAVTGSNGKTIVKDALLHILAGQVRAAGTLGSYNSQLGVALALLRLPREIEVAVMEAGASAPGGMERLTTMIAPEVGILTNIGLAHIGAFGSREAIAREKLQLFGGLPSTGWILAPAECPPLDHWLEGQGSKGDPISRLGRKAPIHRFGAPSNKLPFIETRRSTADGFEIVLRFPGGTSTSITVFTPSTDILVDLEAAAAAAFLLGIKPTAIAAALDHYSPPQTRMEIWRSTTRGVTLINDSCSSDPVSVRSALRSLSHLAAGAGRRVFVFGGMGELGHLDEREHRAIGELAAKAEIDQLVLVGDHDSRGLDTTEAAFRQANAGTTSDVLRLPQPDQLRDRLGPNLRSGDVVLLKGPRHQAIDRAARQLLETMAPGRLLVDLRAIAENVAIIRRRIGPTTKILAMVKALAYGSDAVRLALELQRLGIDSFGVSTPDEGIALRRAGVDRQVLVTLPTAEEAEKVVRYDLTPVLYSIELVEAFELAAHKAERSLDVHLEIDTGMGRVGVFPSELPELARKIAASPWLDASGLMTHFPSADDPAQDDFTRRQLVAFNDAYAVAKASGLGDLTRHAAATAATLRLPESHLDMVRIGLGLYGVYPSPAVQEQVDLELAVALLSRLTDVRHVPAGTTIGYDRTFAVERDDLTVGIVPIGYHDGVPWRLSNQGRVLIDGRSAPILGRISMDSMVADLSEIDNPREGMNVLIWGQADGNELRPEVVAEASGTIVYELLSRLGPRVQRVFSRN